MKLLTLWFEGVFKSLKMMEHLLGLLGILFPALSQLEFLVGLRMTRAENVC